MDEIPWDVLSKLPCGQVGLDKSSLERRFIVRWKLPADWVDIKKWDHCEESTVRDGEWYAVYDVDLPTAIFRARKTYLRQMGVES